METVYEDISEEFGMVLALIDEESEENANDPKLYIDDASIKICLHFSGLFFTADNQILLAMVNLAASIGRAIGNINSALAFAMCQSLLLRLSQKIKHTIILAYDAYLNHYTDDLIYRVILTRVKSDGIFYLSTNVTPLSDQPTHLILREI
jgi:hypothetical protein